MNTQPLSEAIGRLATAIASPPQCVAFKPGASAKAHTTGAQEEIACTLESGGGGNNRQAVAFAQNQLGELRTSEVTNTLNTNSNPSGRNTPMVQTAMHVRRLTPTECERLQGFPDSHTLIPWRTWQEAQRKGTSYEALLAERGQKLREPAGEDCPDGPRYKALGNSMAVNVMRWIGERINLQLDAPARYLSICSGIEAATTAWHHMGWTPAAFSEIEPFPCSVLAHHWPHVPNLGDMTKWESWDEGLMTSIELLVGGTPCQAFSYAGLRQSLDDARGNLTLTYVRIANQIDQIRKQHGKPPITILWENVPGVLNTKDNAFGCFLGALSGEDGPLEPPGGRWTDAGCVSGPERSVAWRCLDAQYVGLAQRRKRVFVVASAGTLRPEQVLFECEGLQRHSPPSREAGQGVAADAGGRAAVSSGQGWPAEVAATLRRENGSPGYANQDLFAQGAANLVPCHTTGQGFWQEGFGTLRAREQDLHENLVASAIPEVADTLRSGSSNPASHGKVNGTDRMTLVPTRWPADIAPTLNAAFGDKQGLEDQHALAGGGIICPVLAETLIATDHKGPGHNRDHNFVIQT